MKKAAKAQELLAERLRPGQAWALRPMEPNPTWMLAPQELRKQKPEPSQWLELEPA